MGQNGRVRLAWLFVLLAGCRFHFSAQERDDAASDNSDSDAIADAVVLGDGATLVTGLTVWYPFETGGPQVQTDAVSNLLATCSATACPMTATGPYGTALAFDGVDDCLFIADAAELHQASITLTAWLQVPSNAPGTIWSKRLSTNNNTWQLAVQAVGSVFFLHNTGSNDRGTPSPGSKIIAGTWQHVAATYNPITGVREYVDGVEVLVDTTEVGVLSYDTNTASIGCTNHQTTSNFFEGNLDELQIYNRALSAAEIAQLAAQ